MAFTAVADSPRPYRPRLTSRVSSAGSNLSLLALSPGRDCSSRGSRRSERLFPGLCCVLQRGRSPARGCSWPHVVSEPRCSIASSALIFDDGAPSEPLPYWVRHRHVSAFCHPSTLLGAGYVAIGHTLAVKDCTPTWNCVSFGVSAVPSPLWSTVPGHLARPRLRP